MSKAIQGCNLSVYWLSCMTSTNKTTPYPFFRCTYISKCHFLFTQCIIGCNICLSIFTLGQWVCFRTIWYWILYSTSSVLEVEYNIIRSFIYTVIDTCWFWKRRIWWLEHIILTVERRHGYKTWFVKPVGKRIFGSSAAERYYTLHKALGL